ncbi:MAG: hypothetical protein Q8P50_03825 [Bacillota bacterium]|nr:hypothetical protein [Bacillota bacterium]
MGRLVVDPDLCVACRNCLLACVVDRHSLSKNLLGAQDENPKPLPRLYLAEHAGGSMPVHCRHCDPAACVIACPTRAMHRDGYGMVVYDDAACIQCFMCVASCPYNACWQSNDRSRVLKCDMCPNRETPACADACPTGAITYDDATESSRSSGGNS